jgi:DNA-binding response OmpR family regulator
MRVLLIEDDKSLSRAVEYRLKKEGLQVECRADGRSGLDAMTGEGPFDLVLLDRMLPGLEGVELLKRVRADGDRTPVRVTGLDAGADDYLVKPFAMEELMARVRALSRRPPVLEPPVAACGDLTLDVWQLLLKRGEAAIPLSKREAALMACLMRNAGQLLPRSLLFDRVWAGSIVEDGNLDTTVHFLRRHLREVGSNAEIRTVRGVGYQLHI